jgi:mannose-6-phosphate isomerase class I
VNWQQAPIVFLDIPKNEIQYRMRAGSIKNLGSERVARASEMYKRFYFVDWVVLNKHKKQLLNKAAVFADAQWVNTINWMTAETLTDALNELNRSVFRVRPWFEAGAWGGQWMKNKFRGLNKEEVNYAWSFELIVPENGLVFESNGLLLELSFDFLMFADNKAVLGKHAATFGDEFPIRFDFLDTWNGGNLSIQCHPTLKYMRETFGEYLTQDETYYIVDCKDNAQVYLGFQENIEPKLFREVLEDSRNNNEVVEIEKFVQAHNAKKHDLFLIPNGTVHSAGANNMVLEISATPYIFTFKMYDWLRLDLNGEPRAINIEHAFNNLSFERKGDRVKETLISKPTQIDSGEDWQLIHLPTHREHFYDIHRIEFDTNVLIETNDSCHVLMLVEGTAISVETADGRTLIFHYAETFVIPAAAIAYRVTNLGAGKAKLVKAFIKENIDFFKTD